MSENCQLIRYIEFSSCYSIKDAIQDKSDANARIGPLEVLKEVDMNGGTRVGQGSKRICGLERRHLHLGHGGHCLNDCPSSRPFSHPNSTE